MLLLAAQLAANILLTLGADARGQSSCWQHSDCPTTQYCDASGLCYSCTYINPSFCDAIDADCCGSSFLANCPSDPYGCGAPTPPPPPGPTPPPAPPPAPRRCVDKGRLNLRFNASYTYSRVESDPQVPNRTSSIEAASHADSYVWEYATGNWVARSVGLITAQCGIDTPTESSNCEIDPFGWM